MCVMGCEKNLEEEPKPDKNNLSLDKLRNGNGESVPEFTFTTLFICLIYMPPISLPRVTWEAYNCILAGIKAERVVHSELQESVSVALKVVLVSILWSPGLVCLEGLTSILQL